MGKIRVYELAKELGLDNHECVKRLVAAGFPVKSHSSTVDEDDARRALTRPAEKKVEEKKPQKFVIRRRRAEEAPVETSAEMAVVAAERAVVESPAPAPAFVEQPVESASRHVSHTTHEIQEPQPVAEPVVRTAEPQPEPPVPSSEDKAPVPVEPVVAATEIPAAVVVAPPVPPKPQTPPAGPVAEPVAPPVSRRAGPPPVPAQGGAAPSGAPRQGGNVRFLERGGPHRDGSKGARGPTQDANAAKAPGQDAPAAGKPAEEAVSRVVRMIDPNAIRERLRSEGRDLNRRPGGNRPFTPNKEFTVQNTGRGGPQVVEVTRGGERPGAPAPAGAKPGKKGKGKGAPGETSMEAGGGRREERRADAREQWMTFGRKKKSTKRGQETQVTTPAAHKRVIEIQGTITVGELARQMSVKVGDVIRKLMGMGMMVTMNQTIDFDTASLIAMGFEFEVKNVEFQETELMGVSEEEPEENLAARPPVVTIMGHVDHGKTSLLDAIRSANVAAGEAGGITQHIGAYSVRTARGTLTFLDTPGHEAFTAMRARGAKVTDIVVLVVAGDDGPMPQTYEAINHAKAAEVPVVVAVNKMDKSDSNMERVMQQLAEQGLVPEQWGGTTMYYPVSAKKKEGINELLEGILLQAEVEELRANPNKRAKGTIVEAQLDGGRGPVATVLVQQGTLRLGDPVVAGDFFGRVRAMYDDRGQTVEAATPSMPVAVLGLDGVPNAGDTFDAVQDADTARTIASHRAMKTREQALAQSSRVTLENFKDRMKASSKDAAKELKLIVKADVQGSVEAVSAALQRLSNNQVKVAIVHNGVGAVTWSDVNLAAASEAIIIGFGVRPDPKAMAHAEQNKVEIRTYSIIYEAVSEVRAAMEGLLAPTYREKYMGRAEVRQTFHVAKVGTVAGCAVVDGRVSRTARVRVVRDSRQIYDGKLASLRRFKDDVKEVAQGYECGLGVENFNDIKVGDVIEAFEVEVIRTKLEGVPEATSPSRSSQPEARV